MEESNRPGTHCDISLTGSDAVGGADRISMSPLRLVPRSEFRWSFNANNSV